MTTTARPVGRTSAGLATQIRETIRAGEVSMGEFLPSVRQLGADHGMAPKTVQRALKQLEREGLVIAEPRQGYRVLARARDPQTGGPVAFVISEASRLEEWDTRNRLMLNAYQQEAARRGWSLLAVPYNRAAPELLIDHLRSAHVSSVVLGVMDTRLLEPLHKLGLPAATMDCWDAYFNLDSVWKDEFHGGSVAAKHLIEHGHRRIGWFGSLRTGNATMRLGGAMSTLLQHGLDMDPHDRVITRPETLEAEAYAFLDRADRPKAMLCLWREVALALGRAAMARGLTLGEDLDIVGWCADEQFGPEYREISPDLARRCASVGYSLGQNARVLLDRLSERRRHPDQPVQRINLPMHVRKPAPILEPAAV